MSEVLQLIQVTSDEYNADIQKLFLEYAQFNQKVAKDDFEFNVDVDEMLNVFMSGIDVFYPPSGRILLAKYDGDFAGIGCLKQISDETGEIKRMFVRPEYRRKGIGKDILDKLIEDSRLIGYTKLLLDSPNVFKAAHKLYELRGFRYISAYEGSEAAEVMPNFAVFMELDL